MEQPNHKPGSIPMSLLCCVCDKDLSSRVVKDMEEQQSYFNLALLGKGTANSHILNYLGLGQREKIVFFSITPTPKARTLLKMLDEALHLEKPGHGIAFLATIHEGCYHKVVHIAEEQPEGEQVEHTSTHDLIMVIVNRGYTEEVMDVARTAGATGGTVLHARGCGLAGAEKFFGITIQPEREVIMIVAGVGESCGIMQAISDSKGHDTDAGAVSFSLPVNGVRGIGRDVPDEVAER